MTHRVGPKGERETKRNVTPQTRYVRTMTPPRTPEPRRRDDGEETTIATTTTTTSRDVVVNDDDARTPSPMMMMTMTHRCGENNHDEDEDAVPSSSSSSPEQEEAETQWRDFASKLNLKDEGTEEPAMPVGGKSNVGSRPKFGAKRFHSPTDAALSPASKFVARKAHHVNHAAAPVNLNDDERSVAVSKPSRFAMGDKENVGAVPVKSRFARA